MAPGEIHYSDAYELMLNGFDRYYLIGILGSQAGAEVSAALEQQAFSFERRGSSPNGLNIGLTL